MMKIEIKTEEFNISKVDEAIKTSQLVYGNEKDKIKANAPVTSRAYIENKHLLNPVKKSLVIQLVQKEQIRGHIFLAERYFVFDGEQHPILVASDLVSKADIPGASLIIFSKALQQSKASKIPLLNFSNKDSDRIYSKIIKIRPVVELDFQILFLNIKSLFEILRKNKASKSDPSMLLVSFEDRIIHDKLKVRLIPKFDDSTNIFFERLEKEKVFYGKRSSEILNWRFNPSNEIAYSRILIIKEETVLGYLVVCERVFRGLRILMIVDSIIWNLNIIEIQKIKVELKKSHPGVVACLTASNLLHQNRFLEKFISFTIPRRFLPERVKFYVSGGDENFYKNLMKAHLTLFDTDIL